MESLILGDLNPIYREIYVKALQKQGLHAYVKEQNLDGWVRAVDVFLVYQKPEELELAQKTIHDLKANL